MQTLPLSPLNCYPKGYFYALQIDNKPISPYWECLDLGNTGVLLVHLCGLYYYYCLYREEKKNNICTCMIWVTWLTILLKLNEVTVTFFYIMKTVGKWSFKHSNTFFLSSMKTQFSSWNFSSINYWSFLQEFSGFLFQTVYNSYISNNSATLLFVIFIFHREAQIAKRTLHNRYCVNTEEKVYNILRAETIKIDKINEGSNLPKLI